MPPRVVEAVRGKEADFFAQRKLLFCLTGIRNKWLGETTTIHKPVLRRDSQFEFGQLREHFTCLENRRRQLQQPLTKAQTLKRTVKSQAEHDASLRICSTPHRQRRTKAQSQDLSRNCQFLEWRHQEQPLTSRCMQNVNSVHGKKGLQ